MNELKMIIVVLFLSETSLFPVYHSNVAVTRTEQRHSSEFILCLEINASFDYERMTPASLTVNVIDCVLNELPAATL